MDIKLRVPEIFPDMGDFWKHLRAARLEFLEAMKSLAQAKPQEGKAAAGSNQGRGTPLGRRRNARERDPHGAVDAH